MKQFYKVYEAVKNYFDLEYLCFSIAFKIFFSLNNQNK